MSLVAAFNRAPDGEQTPTELARDVATICKAAVEPLFKSAGADDMRRQEMRKRLDFYRDRGSKWIEEAVKALWIDSEIQADHLRVVPFARFHNFLKKVARIAGTVYAEPAKRKVTKGQEALDLFARKTSLDLKLREANRLTLPVNEVFLLVGKRTVRGKVLPKLSVITPDAFTAVADPNDPTEHVAIVLDAKPGGIGVKEGDPHHVLWADDVIALLNKAGQYISHKANPYGRIPGVLVHRSAVVETVLDQDSGRDLLDVQFAIALTHVMMMRGQKVGTKVPYATGDMSTTAHGQVMDHTKLTKFEEGVSPGVLDLGHDPKDLLEVARSIAAQGAAIYDIPEDVYTMMHTPTSGYDRQLKRIGLDERRAEQVPIFREAEHELAEIAEVVGTEWEPEYRFTAKGFTVDFGEVKTPQDPTAELAWRKEAKAQLLRTTIDDLMADNPDLSRDDAEALFLEILAWRAKEVELQRRLNMPRDPTDPGASPEANGAKGPRAASAPPADDAGEEGGDAQGDDGPNGRDG